MRRDDLEEALHDAFDHDHLALYAEELQRLGDPRGELIALDLRAREQVAEEISHDSLYGEAADRRRELLGELLGPAASHPLVRCRYGFVDLMFAFQHEMLAGSMAAFDGVLRGPLGTYVRDVTFYGDGPRLRELMTQLAQRPRPFLRRLSLEGPHELHYVDLPREVAVRAASMMPRLRTLEAKGRRVIPMVEFPTVREVVAHCADAVTGLTASSGGPPCFPAADSVNLRLVWTLPQSQLEALLPPTQLPALRELDVSRCTEPVGADAGYDVFKYLRGIAIAPQIERLRVPPVEHVEQAANLQAAINRMPSLVELGLVGTYPLRAEPLRHPTAAIRPIV
ncbi:MAG TPA: hypothetical protein VNO30_02565 [Kofleriaceae bacterium]|nr:hypothetical protein [Kofleriaceae bacterium]